MLHYICNYFGNMVKPQPGVLLSAYFIFGPEDYKKYRLDQEIFGALILMSDSLNIYGKYTTSILEEELKNIAQTAEGIGRTDISRTSREVGNNLQIHDDEIAYGPTLKGGSTFFGRRIKSSV